MFTELFRVKGPWPGQLAISARPRGGDWLEDEIRAWRSAGIGAVVSLLEPDESAALQLGDEKFQCESAGIDFLSIPIVDRGIPAADIHAILSRIGAMLRQGKNVAIHCRQGVGRAGLIAAALLIDQDISPADAIRRVTAARGVNVPETEEQRVWIETFAATPSREL